MSAGDVVLHVGLLVTYMMALEMSLPNPSSAYAAQAVCSSAAQEPVSVAYIVKIGSFAHCQNDHTADPLVQGQQLATNYSLHANMTKNCKHDSTLK